MSITPGSNPFGPNPEQEAPTAQQQPPAYQQPGYQQPGYQQPPYQQPVYQQPPYQPAYAAPAAPTTQKTWFAPVVIVALVVLAIGNVILFYELSDLQKRFDQQVTDLKDRSNVLDHRLAASNERQNSMSAEMTVTREKMGKELKLNAGDIARARAMATQLGEEQKAAQAQIGQVGQQVSSLAQEASTKIAAVNTEVGAAKTDIAATRKDLEATKVQLTSAIGDITKANTLIARNHDELLELRRRGERNFIEFDLPKEKQPRRIGDISMQLKNADPKKQKYSVLLIAEDAHNEKKDKTVNEPVQFYMGRSRALYEVVVNKVTKDRITGYLSTPKQ